MKNYTKRHYLLYSYLATEMLAPFYASFIIMNCIFLLVKLIPFLDLVLELNIGFGDFVRSLSYLFPNMLLYTIPMAAMMGVIIGFTRLSNDTEILAFKACGLSIYNMLPPVLIVSTIISILCGYISVNLIPKGETAMKQIMYQLTKEKIEAGIKEKQFTTSLGDLVIHVDHVNKRSGEWEDVWVSDMRGQLTPTIIMSKTGRMKANIDTMLVTVVLNQGSLHKANGTISRIIAFDNYTLNIPLNPPTNKNTLPGVSSMGMTELRDKAQEIGVNTKLGRKYLVHFHKRIVLPAGCLIVCLMALPLGLQSGPGKKAAGIPLGLGFFIFYYVFFTIGKNLATETDFPVGIVMWLPNILLMVLTAVAIRRVSNEESLIPVGISSRLSDLFIFIVSLIYKLFRRTV